MQKCKNEDKIDRWPYGVGFGLEAVEATLQISQYKAGDPTLYYKLSEESRHRNAHQIHHVKVVHERAVLVNN